MITIHDLLSSLPRESPLVDELRLPAPTAEPAPFGLAKAQGHWDIKAVGLIHKILKGATDPTLGIPMLLAGPTYQVIRGALLRGLLARGGAAWAGQTLALKLLPPVVGFVGETVVFGVGSRALTHTLKESLPWDVASVLADTAWSGMTLALLKSATFIGTQGTLWKRGLDEFSPNIWTRADHRALLVASNVSGYLGLAGAQGLHQALSPHPSHGGGNIWVDAFSTHLALGMASAAGMAALGPRFRATIQKINFQAHRLYRQARQPWDFFQHGPLIRTAGGLMQLAGPAEPVRPLSPLMEQGKDGPGLKGDFPFPALSKDDPVLRTKQDLGFPKDTPVVRLPEPLGEKTPEESIAQTILDHVKHSPSDGKPFIVLYEGKQKVEIYDIKERIQEAIIRRFSRGYRVGVASPLAPIPLLISYTHKGRELDTNFSLLISPRSSRYDRGPKEDSTGSTPEPTPPMKLPGFEEGKSGKDRLEFLDPNITVSNFSEAVKALGRILDSAKETPSYNSWFMEITQPFFELTPQEIQAISSENVMKTARVAERREAQARIAERIKERVFEDLRKLLWDHPILPGKVIHLNWQLPIRGFLTLKGKGGSDIEATLSGTGILKTKILLTPYDLLTRSYSKPSLDPSTPKQKGEKPEGPVPHKESNPDAVRLTLDDPSHLIPNLNILGQKLQDPVDTRPVHIEVRSGRPNEEFISDLAASLLLHPLVKQTRIEILWGDSNFTTKVRQEDNEILVTLAKKVGDLEYAYSVRIDSDKVRKIFEISGKTSGSVFEIGKREPPPEIREALFGPKS